MSSRIASFTSRPNDLVRWEIKIEREYDTLPTFGRAPYATMIGPSEASLLLQAVTQEECEAVIALINTMRSNPISAPMPEPLKLGDRFSGLDLNG